MTAQFTSVIKALDAAGSTEVKLTSRGVYDRRFKRALDILAILITLPLIVPVIAILAILTALDGHNPFYWQERVGRHGRVFRIWKLRTMVPDADELLSAYLDAHPEARAEWELTQKLKSDPRITRVGAILRKTSLDELPQLWNVLKGQMSLVGPRPMMTSQQHLYHGFAYYTLRPGITGLWQVTDRNSSAFEKRVEYDTEYAEKLSFRLDLSILVRTLGVVTKGTGY